MLEQIAKIGLFFSQPPVLIGVVIFGFTFISEKQYGKALFLLLFTMIYNVYLKYCWQMPLPPPLEGWAFPSGHMHCAFVFWGWLAITYRKLWLSAVITLLLCFVGYGLIYHGYHYPIDILGAAAFGSFSLFIYSRLQKIPLMEAKPYYLGMLTSFLGLIFIMLLPPENRKLHIWQALGGTIGFTLGWWWLHKKNVTLNLGQQGLAFIIAILGATSIILWCNLPLSLAAAIFVKFFVSALWISTSKVTATSFYLFSRRFTFLNFRRNFRLLD